MDRPQELRRIREAAEAGFSSLGSLRTRKSVVVGGAGDLGAAAALGLAAAGADVLVASRNVDRCEAVCAAGKGLPGRMLAADVDVRHSDQLARLFATAGDEWGRVDIVVNAMGVNVRRPAAEVELDDWDQVIDTNLRGVFLSCQAAFRIMAPAGYGRMVNIASAAGLAARAWPTTSVYGTSKAGVIHLTKYLAAEWAPSGITVNALAPGYLLTQLTRPLVAQAGALDRLMEFVPLRRMGEISEFVGPLLFLASDASSYMTGHTLVVDGGRVIL